MERFQKIKAGRKKLDITSICRFCGLENEERYNILELNEDGIQFSTKVSSMMSINIHFRDKMPQNVCFICMDKINDFYEFRLMALNTDKQTREALGLPLVEERMPPPPPPQLQQKPKFNQFDQMTPVVRLVDLKYSIQDQALIKKALSRLSQMKEPNIPSKRPAPTSTVTSQQPPNKKTRKDIICNICSDASFSYLNDLQDHQIKMHLPLVSKYACGSCRETFEQLSDFKDHELFHSKKKLPYTCYICFSPYAKLKDFQKHMTNYNCKEKEKLIVTYEDIKCMMCKKKYLTQNLFEWHGCFLKTRGSCLKCGQYFQKKKALLKHYVLCEAEFVTPEAARDPNRNVIKSETVSPSSRGSVVKVTGGVRKKTVPQRRMTTIKAEKEINLGNVSQQQLAEDEEDDEYANYEEDITYDNFGDSDDDEDSAGPSLTNLEPVVELNEQTPLPRIIDIKAEKSSERSAVNQSTLGGADPQIIRSIKQEQGSKPVVSTDRVQQQQLALRIKAERGANEQPVVQVLNPLAIGSSAAKTTTITARKKVFKLPPELAAKIKQEKVSAGDDMRDEAEPDPEEEAAMEAARISPPALIKEEKLDSAYGDDVGKEKEQSNTTKQLINPMAIAMMREKSVTTNGSESIKNSLVISAVTSMSANPSTTTNGERETTAKEDDDMAQQSAHEDNSTTTTTTTTMEGSGNNGNSVEVKESSFSSACAQVLNPVMVEIPAEFNSKASSEQQHFSPAVTEMSSTVSAVSNEVATTSDVTSAEAMNINEEDDELNLLLENLEKFGGDSDISVANNLQDSDLQDLLKFD